MIVSGCITTHNTPSDHDTAAAMPSQTASRGDRLSAPRHTRMSRYLKPASRRPIAAGGFSAANGLGATIRKVRKAMSKVAESTLIHGRRRPDMASR